MEYQYVILVLIATVFALLFRNTFTNSPREHLSIREAYNAKEFLNSSNLLSRTKSNWHLHFTFGISNPFTNPDIAYHAAFRKVILKTINFNDEKWQRVKNIAFEAVKEYTNLEEGDVVEIVPWIQHITLSVVLRGYLGMDVNVEEVINDAPGIINDLWLNSKELGGAINEQKEKSALILKTKRILENLFSKAEYSQRGAGKTPNVMQEISRTARKHFSNVFENIDSNVDGSEEQTKGAHKPLANELESPLNILIPAYETMWRVVLYAILEIKVRPSSSNENVNERINFEKLDKAIKIFLEKPNHSTLKKKEEVLPLWCVVQETLRLYPPTRHIHRVDDKGLRVTVDLETIHRDSKTWGEDALLFKPERFLKPNEAPYIPFSVGPLKCIASDKFAPTLAAIIISAILSRVDKVILSQQSKDALLQKEKLPFENNRRAFDKFKVTLTKKA